jgi:ankyrin repeat protein
MGSIREAPAVSAASRWIAALFMAMTAACGGVMWTASDQHLLDALKAKDAVGVEAALSRGAKANIVYADGMQPLAVAVARNDHASAQALLRAGADANITADVGSAGGTQGTKSGLLALAEDSEMVAILVKGGADPNRKDAAGETPLGRAVLNGDAAVTRLLLQVGADVDSPLADGRLPLSFAVSTGNIEVVKALLDGGADPNREVGDGRTVLHEAAGNPNGAIAALLLKAKAHPDPRSGDATTPLMAATAEGYAGPVRALLDGGADPNLRNAAGMTALDLANANSQTQVATLLQEAGGEATRDAAEARAQVEQLQREARGADLLRIFTTDVVTDGRNVKIRGRVRNQFPEPVRGLRYRVSFYARGTNRPLDAFVDERSDTEIPPGGEEALRLDIASMYGAGEFTFVVEALPMRIGEREVRIPAHWTVGHGHVD